MKQTQIIMGMPITVEVVGPCVTEAAVAAVFAFFRSIDERFSVYKPTSEISQINKGLLQEEAYSSDMKEVLRLCEQTKQETGGYFDIRARNGTLDPSGLVKGWAILRASKMLKGLGCADFSLEAGGDIEVSGKNEEGKPWSVGIRHPFSLQEIVKVVYLHDQGIATSGTYLRGQHVYNPFAKDQPLKEIVSLTVIGPNVYEADRFATAAFVMGREGIQFIERLPGFEGYMIDKNGMATMTTYFDRYTHPYAYMD